MLGVDGVAFLIGLDLQVFCGVVCEELEGIDTG